MANTGSGMKRSHALALFAVLLAVLIAADQLAKAHIRATLGTVGATSPGIPGIFQFELVHNTGAAFGMFPGGQMFFVAVAAIVLIAVVVYLLRGSDLRLGVVISLSMVCAGAVGNVIDRLTLGYVTDFVSLLFMDFAVFNVADMCITVGCALFIICMLLSLREEAGDE